MVETTLVYVAVALAAGFVLWTVVLPKRLRRAIVRPMSRKNAKGCGDDCGCG